MRPVTEDELQAYVDDALEEGRRGELIPYLAHHVDVAYRIEAYQAQREMMREVFAPIAEEPLPPELNFPRMLEARRHATLAPWRRGATALLLLCLGGLAGWSVHDISEPAPAGIVALTREAAESYAVYATDRDQPVEIKAAERARLVAWASQRLGHPVAVPDLSYAGYRFMGGRMVATGYGPAVLFMYDDARGNRLVMLSRPLPTDRATSLLQQSSGPIVGFAWAYDGMGYSLVGRLAADALQPIADEARRQLRNL